MYTILIVFYVLVSAALIGLVLIQHGKGADAGAAFGSGASGTVFGARGSANFLSRSTAWLAALFFALSLTLAYFLHGQAAPRSVMDVVPSAAKVELPAPAAPTPKIDVVPAAVQPPAAGAAKPAAPTAAPSAPSAPAPATAAPVVQTPPKPATPKVPD